MFYIYRPKITLLLKGTMRKNSIFFCTFLLTMPLLHGGFFDFLSSITSSSSGPSLASYATIQDALSQIKVKLEELIKKMATTKADMHAYTKQVVAGRDETDAAYAQVAQTKALPKPIQSTMLSALEKQQSALDAVAAILTRTSNMAQRITTQEGPAILRAIDAIKQTS